MKFKVVGLVSGGKDSIYNLLQCVSAGHEIIAIANLEPMPPDKAKVPAPSVDELDSYMYQTVGHQAVSLLSGALGVPIYRQRTKGLAICKDKDYVVTEDDEVEDMFALLAKVKEDKSIEAVAVGAIASDYQRTRVESVCGRLKLRVLAYLWGRNQSELLKEMIDANMNAIIIKIACMGLSPEVHLGMNLKEIQPEVKKLHRKFGVNECGEGGEYETFTLDCPLFHRSIHVGQSKKVVHSNDAFAPIAYLTISNATLETKSWGNIEHSRTLNGRIEVVKKLVPGPLHYIEDCLNQLTIEPANSSHTNPEAQTARSTIGSGPHTGHVTFSSSTLLGMDTGLSARNLTTGWCVVGNVTGLSVKDALTFLQRHLELSQYNFSDIVHITIFLQSMSDYAALNKKYEELVPGLYPPTRACVAVPLHADTPLILYAVAHRQVSKTLKMMHHNVERNCIHVQSISHWAPANIGPYSQSISVGELIYLAGQIPLIPGSMEMLDRPLLLQCQLIARHLNRILAATQANIDTDNIFHIIWYVTADVYGVEMSSIWRYVSQNEHSTMCSVLVTALPKNAPVECQAIAVTYDQPKNDHSVEDINMHNFRFRFKKCYFEQPTASIVCYVGAYKAKSGKYKLQPAVMTTEIMIDILLLAVQHLRGLYPICTLCNLVVFCNISEPNLVIIVAEAIKNLNDPKIISTCVPVLACCEPNAFMAITGTCN